MRAIPHPLLRLQVVYATGGLQGGLSCAAFTCAISVFIDKMQPEAATASEGDLLRKASKYL